MTYAANPESPGAHPDVPHDSVITVQGPAPRDQKLPKS